jgi:Alr-MurF fusion protein
LGQDPYSKYKISDIKIEAGHSQFSILNSQFSIPFTDAASTENCLHCIALMIELGYPPEIIQQRIAQLHNLPMRLELKYGINNCTIIDDSYSADFLSLQIALDFLKQQETNKNKTLIISSFDESGLTDAAFIEKLVGILRQYDFSRLIGVGTLFLKNTEAFNHKIKEWYVYPDTEALLANFHQLHFENEIILVKGARRFHFEQVTQELSGQTHATAMEINLNALTHNLNVYRSFLGSKTGVIAMVKAFSYGVGSVEVASLLETQRVAYLAVAYADEGVHLRKNGIRLPVMVMNPDAADFDRMLEYQLEPEIYSLNIIQQLVQKLNGEKFKIHLKVETGMNRLGFTEVQLDALIKILQENNNLEVSTVFSHLSGSEEAQFDEFTVSQIARFEMICVKIETQLGHPVKKHLLNSSGIIRFKQAHYDFVRLGIGLYGVDSSESIQQQLQPIGRLKTRISQVKLVKKGETVGYSRSGVATKDSQIAVLAIGYADGYDRRFGNGVGEVWVNGQHAKVIGNICMDMTMIDVTHIENIEAGDEAEIFGKHISIIGAAKKIGTIAYELLTGISPRVKRVYYLD